MELLKPAGERDVESATPLIEAGKPSSSAPAELDPELDPAEKSHLPFFEFWEAKHAEDAANAPLWTAQDV